MNPRRLPLVTPPVAPAGPGPLPRPARAGGIGTAAQRFVAALGGRHRRAVASIFGVPRLLALAPRGRSTHEVHHIREIERRASPVLNLSVHPVVRLLRQVRTVLMTGQPPALRTVLAVPATPAAAARASLGERPAGTRPARHTAAVDPVRRLVAVPPSPAPPPVAARGRRVEAVLPSLPHLLATQLATPGPAPRTPAGHPPEDGARPAPAPAAQPAPSTPSMPESVELLADAVLKRIDRRLLSERERRERWP